MATRKIHKVRITHPTKEKIWANIKVYDTVTFVGPNGQEMLLDFRQKRVTPKIIDETGHGNEVDNSEPSRLSHMETIQGEDGNTFDAEILDGLSFIGPNGKRGVLLMPSDDAGMDIEDDADIGIVSSGVTRRGHTEKVEKGNNSDTKWIGVVTTDAIRFQTENGNESVLKLSKEDDEEDTTEYVGTDEDGDPKPPENSDKNKYLYFPPESKGPWVKKGTLGTGVSQGLLWKIDKARSGGFRYFLFLSAGSQFSWDGGFGSPIEGNRFNLTAATAPFSAFDDFINAGGTHETPPGQLVSPPSFPGVNSVQTDGVVAYEHSISSAALLDDDFIQARWEQFDNEATLGPFVWDVINDAIFNVNLLGVGDSATFTIDASGDGHTITFFMMRFPEDRPDDDADLDIGLPGNDAGFEFAPDLFANLVTSGGASSVTLTRTGADTWEFGGPDTFDYDGPGGEGWGVRNVQFPED